MKKVGLLFLILIISIPAIVSAQAEGVSIKSIELVEKSTGATELASPRHEGLEVFFHVKFKELQDKAKYKVVIENTSDNQYEITTTNNFDGREYMTYTYSFEEEGNIVNPNSSKTMYVEVRYSSEVPDNKYVNGKYSEENAFNILVDKPSAPADPDPTEPDEPDPEPEPEKEEPKEEEEIENPDTGANLPWIILVSVLIIGLGVYLAIQKKLPLRKVSGFIIAIGISIPIIASAIEQLYVKVNVYVEIEKQAPPTQTKTFTLDCSYEPEYPYHFEEGMTWEEFINSEYNVDGFYFEERYDDVENEFVNTITMYSNYYIIPRSEYIEAKEYVCSEEYMYPVDCCHDFGGEIGEICNESVCYMDEPDAEFCCSLSEFSYTCNYSCLFGEG